MGLLKMVEKPSSDHHKFQDSDVLLEPHTFAEHQQQTSKFHKYWWRLF